MKKKKSTALFLALLMIASVFLNTTSVFAENDQEIPEVNQSVEEVEDKKDALEEVKAEDGLEISKEEIPEAVGEPAAEKTFILKKADGTVLGQYDEIKDGFDESTILGMMKKTDPNASYIIEVTKDYEFEGNSRSVISGLNITFTSKEGTSPVLTSGNGMPHFFLKDGNYTFKNIILEGKSGSTGGGIYTHEDNQGVTITLDSGTVIRNCNYIDAPYYYRTLVIRDEYTNDGKDSTLIINDGVIIENNKLNSQNGGSPISVRKGCKLIVNGGEFKNNEAQYTRKGGGVIFNEEGAETIINGGNFEGNKAAAYGGAIINYGKLTVNAGTFKGNEASNGGAICSLADNNELIVNGGTFVNNKGSNILGGAIVANNKVRIENATFDGNTSVKGGAVFVRNSNDASIKNNTFSKNTAKFGGALFVNNLEGTIEGNTFEENFAERFSSAFHVTDSAPAIKNNIYKNNGKKDDKTTANATLMVESVKAGKELTIEKDKFENNVASKGGGAIVVAEGTVNLKGCEFTNSKVPEYGGAIYITYDGKVTIAGSKFIGNSAKRGGAIVTEKFSQANPAEAEKYANLKIADDVVFDKNIASDGYFNPPMNYDKFPDLKFKTTSLMGQLRAINSDMKTYKKVDSVLNNYDVYYVNPLVTVIYNSNGGTPEEKICGEELISENDEIKPAEHKVKSVKEAGLSKEGFEFKGWNTQADGKGTAYKEGDTFKLSSNKILYAIWGAKTPEPKPEPKPERIFIPYVPVLNKEDHYQYLIGYKDNTFRPENNMTREEVAVMFSRLLKNPPKKGEIYNYKFSDVNKDRWSVTAISYMSELGIIKGYPDGTFRPEANITRAEFAAMATKFADLKEGFKTFRDLDKNHWAYDFISKAATAGWINGYPDGTFKPDNKITRAEVVSITNLMLNRKADEKFVDSNLDKLLKYKDVPKSHWAYYKIFEATNGHDFVRKSNKIDEEWKDITNKSFVYDK